MKDENIIVMANVLLRDYGADLISFQRRNVTIKHVEQKLKPQVAYWSDDGRFLVSSGTMGSTLNISVELMPIYRPDLIVMLNEDGTLFKDGGLASKNDLEKILSVNEVRTWEKRLEDMIGNK